MVPCRFGKKGMDESRNLMYVIFLESVNILCPYINRKKGRATLNST